MPNTVTLLTTIANSTRAILHTKDGGLSYTPAVLLGTGADAGKYQTVYTGLTAGTIPGGTFGHRFAGEPALAVFVSTALTVTAASPVLALTSAQFTQNAYDEDFTATAPNYRRRSPLDTSVPISISGATAVKITQVVTQNDAFTAQATGFATVNGGQKTYFDNGGLLTKVFTVALPDLGTHVLRLTEGQSQRPNEQGAVLTGGTFTHVEPIGTSATYTVGAAPKTASAAYIDVDSIGASTGASRVDLGWLVRLRPLLGFDVAASGYGSRGLSTSLGTAAQRDANLVRLQAYMAGRTGRKIYVLDLGTNDYGVQYGSPATAAAAAGAMLDAVNTAGGFEVWLKTPIFRPDQAANSFGATFTDYANAYLNLATGRAWLKVLNAGTWLSRADLAPDLIHPADNGHAIMASRYFEALSVDAVADAAYTQNVALNAGRTDSVAAGTYVLMRDSQGYNLQDFTVMIRLNPAAIYDGQQLAAKAVVDQTPNVGGIGMFGIYTDATGKINGGVFAAGGGGTFLTAPAAMTVNAPVWAALVSSRSEVRLHINASVVTGLAVATVGSIADNVTFGGVRKINPNASGNAFNGTLLHGAFFNVALDAATINGIFTANGLTPAQYENPNCLLDTSFKVQPGGTVMYNRADTVRNLDLVTG